jgi:hypothetical protein
MTDKDFNELIELSFAGGGWIPTNEKAKELAETQRRGEISYFKNMTPRDIKLHRCYFSLLNFIYDYMPNVFKNAVPLNKFYIWLKHLKGEYEIIFQFNDGTSLIEYESISFGRMNNHKFKEYIKNQLPYIYENVIGKYYEDDMYHDIIDTIEEEYEKFMSKLD